VTHEMSVGARTDLHSHLVPGVDDGSRNLEEALEGIARMWALGYTHLVTTPHLDASLTRDGIGFAARMTEVDEALEMLRASVSERHPDLTVSRGHEIRLDRPDPDLSDPRLRLGESDVVLIEWPAMAVPPETPAVLRGLRDQGVRPMIAHPERYRGYGPDLGIVARWREEGGLLQMNLGSLTDRYGSGVRAAALRLLEHGLVDCLASDFHGRPHLPFFFDEARAVFEEADALQAWDVLTLTNPDRIIRGEEPWAVPSVRLPQPPLERLRSFFRRGF
jgi:protein-tyrosine phosphatase